MKYSNVKVCSKEQPTVVAITSDEKPNISDLMVEKWQDIIDLLALTVNVPSALIMRLEEKHMYVFLASNTKDNPYCKKGYPLCYLQETHTYVFPQDA